MNNQIPSLSIDFIFFFSPTISIFNSLLLPHLYSPIFPLFFHHLLFHLRCIGRGAPPESPTSSSRIHPRQQQRPTQRSSFRRTTRNRTWPRRRRFASDLLRMRFTLSLFYSFYVLSSCGFSLPQVHLTRPSLLLIGIFLFRIFNVMLSIFALAS